MHTPIQTNCIIPGGSHAGYTSFYALTSIQFIPVMEWSNKIEAC